MGIISRVKSLFKKKEEKKDTTTSTVSFTPNQQKETIKLFQENLRK